MNQKRAKPKRRPASGGLSTGDENLCAAQPDFYQSVVDVVRVARSHAYRAINFVMVEAYWKVGRMIVEEEQLGKGRAEYGKLLMSKLSRRLTGEFGKGFA